MTREQFRRAPFASAAALTNWRHAAVRAAKLLMRCARCRYVRWEIDGKPAVQRGREQGDQIERQTLPLDHEGMAIGRLLIDIAPAAWTMFRDDIQSMGRTLAMLIAVQQRIPAAMQTRVVVSSSTLHALNNAINTLSMQLDAAQALVTRGEAGEAARFLEEAALQSERLGERLAVLRK